MLRNVFTKTLRDGRRGLIGWAIAVASVGALYAVLWPSMNVPEMQDMLDTYPEFMLEAMNYTDTATPAGYVSSTVFGMLGALMIVVYAIGLGTRAVAGDEEAGTLELILAHPVGRTRLALHRIAAMIVALSITGFGLWLALMAVSGPGELDEITPAEFGAATLQLVLFGIAFGSLAFAIGSVTGRRVLALSTTSGVAVLAYLAQGVFPQVESLEWTRNVSPWHWLLDGEPLRYGLQIGDCGLLLAVTAVCLAVGLRGFNRRDVAV